MKATPVLRGAGEFRARMKSAATFELELKSEFSQICLNCFGLQALPPATLKTRRAAEIDACRVHGENADTRLRSDDLFAGEDSLLI